MTTFWDQLRCRYCNPDDPRRFVFVSNVNDRLGVTVNLANGAGKHLLHQFAFGSVAVILPGLLLYLYDRHFMWLFQLLFWSVLLARTILLRRFAKADLADSPGLPGPRDGSPEIVSADGTLRLALKVLAVFFGALLLIPVTVVTVVHGLPSAHEVLIVVSVFALVATCSILFVGLIGLYLRASRRLVWGLIVFGAVWTAVLGPTMWFKVRAHRAEARDAHLSESAEIQSLRE